PFTRFISAFFPPQSTALLPYTTLFRSRAPGGARGQSGRCEGRPAPHYRQPQLHDDPDGRGAEGDRGSFAHPPRTRFDLPVGQRGGRKSTRLNSSHVSISYAVFCLKIKK